jgi:hypothetical protein
VVCYSKDQKITVSSSKFSLYSLDNPHRGLGLAIGKAAAAAAAPHRRLPEADEQPLHSEFGGDRPVHSKSHLFLTERSLFLSDAKVGDRFMGR